MAKAGAAALSFRHRRYPGLSTGQRRDRSCLTRSVALRSVWEGSGMSEENKALFKGIVEAVFSHGDLGRSVALAVPRRRTRGS